MKFLITIMTSGVILGFLTSMLLAFTLFQRTAPTVWTWAGKDAEGQTIEYCEATVLSQPFVDAAAIQDFTKDAALSINNYGYLDWNERLPGILSKYFSEAAAQRYIDLFSRSPLLESVEQNYYSVTARGTLPAAIVEEGFDGQRRYWLVEAPIEVTYSPSQALGFGNRLGDRVSKAKIYVEKRVYTARIIEEPPTSENFRGIAIVDLDSVRVRDFISFERQ